MSEVEQSESLSTAEVTDIVDGAAPEEAVLPSDQVDFEVPEKFKGKSVEDVIKSYQELEKFKGKDKEGGDEVSQEEKGSDEPEETPKETTKLEQDTYNKYLSDYQEKGELSAEQYSELAKAGYNKEAVEAEINRVNDYKGFQDYKQSRELDSVLEPLGGGQDKFKEVAAWASESKSADEVESFNKALADSGKLAQQALLKGLYEEYSEAGNAEGTILHTNTPQTTPSKGYSTQEEFFKDVGSEEYQNNPAYRKAVENKMAKSSIF